MTDSDADVLQRLVAEHDVEFILTMFVDLHGKPCAKLVPASSLDVVMGGAGFAGFAAGAMAQRPSDPDLIAVPDVNSFMPAPWQPGLAVLMCDVSVEGELWPYSPRVILGRALAGLASRGLELRCGLEPEYSLVRRDGHGGLQIADAADNSSSPCYDAVALSRMYDHLSTVSKYMNQLGFGNYANDHEDGNGQFEQNYTYANAMVTADRLIFIRFMLRVMAERAGMIATFMPKPFTDLTGNGLHIHLSLWDTESGEPRFETDGDDPVGLGLSALGYSFAAGVLEHAPSLAAICCPTVNSYKRLGAPAPRSGATWAPTHVAFGGNNRTHLLRVPEPGRIEYRGVDGAANPYLAMAAILGAGLDGVDRSLESPPVNSSNLFDLSAEELTARGIRRLPPTLLHATEMLTANDVIRRALGAGDRGDYIDYFAQVKSDEFFAWHSTVSPWEIDRYLSWF
jgi:glutamine synthetase